MTTETKPPEMTALEMAQRILQMASKSPNAITHLQNDECRLAGALIDSEARNAELAKRVGELEASVAEWKANFSFISNSLELNRAILERCEVDGFAFQRAFVASLRAIVTRRREGCNEEQAQFWMSVATVEQKDEAFKDAIYILLATIETH